MTINIRLDGAITRQIAQSLAVSWLNECIHLYNNRLEPVNIFFPPHTFGGTLKAMHQEEQTIEVRIAPRGNLDAQTRLNKALGLIKAAMPYFELIDLATIHMSPEEIEKWNKLKAEMEETTKERADATQPL